MRFIRKNGRVIPIRDRIARGVEVGSAPGAALVGGVVGSLSSLGHGKVNPVSFAFWGLKGAVAGAAAGAVLGAAGHAGKKIAPAGPAEMTAFKRAGALATLGSVSRLARPFVSKTKVGKAIALAGYFGGSIGSIASAYHSAATAKKGTRGRVLAAGAVGSILGTNVMRAGSFLVHNRKSLGLRRII